MASFFQMDNLLSLGIGLMVSVVIIIAFERAMGTPLTVTMRRARDVLAVIAGLFVYFALRESPELLDESSRRVLAALVGLLLAFLVFLRRSLR